jgi:hypothetical protein
MGRVPGKVRQVAGRSMGGRLVGGADSDRRVAAVVDVKPLRAQAVMPAPGLHLGTTGTPPTMSSSRSTLSIARPQQSQMAAVPYSRSWGRGPASPPEDRSGTCRRSSGYLFGDGKGPRIGLGRTPSRTPAGMPSSFRIPASRTGNPRIRRPRPTPSRRMTAARSRSAAGSTSDTATKSRHTSEAVTPAPHCRSARIALRSHLPFTSRMSLAKTLMLHA